MDNTENELKYYIYESYGDILIKTVTEFYSKPEPPTSASTAIYICRDYYDAIQIVSFLLQRDSEKPETMSDFVFEVKRAYWSDPAFLNARKHDSI